MKTSKIYANKTCNYNADRMQFIKKKICKIKRYLNLKQKVSLSLRQNSVERYDCCVLVFCSLNTVTVTRIQIKMFTVTNIIYPLPIFTVTITFCHIISFKLMKLTVKCKNELPMIMSLNRCPARSICVSQSHTLNTFSFNQLVSIIRLTENSIFTLKMYKVQCCSMSLKNMSVNTCHSDFTVPVTHKHV